MQRYTVFFIIVNVLHVSGGFSAHHQELGFQPNCSWINIIIIIIIIIINCTHSIWYVPGLFAATASRGELELNHTSGSSKQT